MKIIRKLKREISLHGRVDATEYISSHPDKDHNHEGVIDSIVFLMEGTGKFKSERNIDGHAIVTAIPKSKNDFIYKAMLVILGGIVTIIVNTIISSLAESKHREEPKTNIQQNSSRSIAP